MDGRRPQLWVVAGPNGAGKTTLVTHRVATRIPVVNPDAIAQELPLIDGRLDERRAGTMAIELRDALLRAGESLAIETTLSGNSALRFMTAAKAAGYRTTLVFVGLRNAETSGRRVADRVRRGGHPVPVSAILRRYPDTLAKLPRAMDLAERAFVLDNSGERRRLLLVIEDERVRFLARDLPAWFRNALPDLA
ncbi:zeta toxin family protein [Sphingomonas lenta]|uniref:Zeta toxin family protein n=1 Tax=Sphingomonas lenta TaxID=1141887 RepID=A0A2A2SFQ5_9SPHN|nr:zeta toxin family protein [Sphingomonas lenta]PAX08032.1 zeta toxin family protein [Sphingomonas lenta]